MNLRTSDSSKPVSLLIVDDDPDILSVTQQYLKTNFSYDVDTVSSVDRARSMIKETPYDAIIADYEMEGKNGIDLLNSIRSEGDETPFIIFTGKGREEVVIAAYESGADGYVQKGWDIRSQFAELAHKINTTIQKKQAEQAHKKIEQEYRSLYEEAPDAYFSLDNQWQITRCNIRAAEMMGIPRESLTTSSFCDLFPDLPEGKERIITLFKRFLAGNIIRNEEVVIQRGDGTFNAVTVSISASYDESGNLSVSRAIIHDISYQKQAEITLQATRKSLDEAHKLAKIGIWDWEIAQERITWSEELYLITGWDPHTPPPPVTEQSHLYTQESWQRLQTAVTHILDTGESYDLELQIIRPDRELIWVRALGEPVYDLTGNIIGLHGTVQDISRQKESEVKTSLHTARLHALLTLNQIAESSPSEILDYAIEASLKITGSSYSFFGLIDADQQMMTVHSWSRDAMRGCDIQQKPMQFPIASAGIWADTIRKKRAQVINDYSALHQDVCKWPKGHVPITRFVGAPICSGEKIVAIIAVANKPDDYQEDDVQSLTAFGNEIWRILNQKKAEESLQKSEERFRQLFNNASDAILLHEIREDRTPGKFLEVNDAACKKLGYTREEILTLEVSDINTPQSNALIPEIAPALFENSHITFECSHQTKNREIIPVEVATHLFELNHQKVALAICRDISERKLAEEMISRSQRQLADIINFLPDPTFVINKSGTVISWNQAMEKLTGVMASDMIGKNNYEYAIPFYGERRPILIDLAMKFDEDLSNQYEEFQKTGQQVVSEAIIANFRGEDVTLWSIATPLYDQYGWLIGSIESIRDVTARKKTQDALHEALETLKTVMDSLDALVYVCDMETYEILFLNQFGRSIWGEVIGKKCYASLQENQSVPCSFCTNAKIVDNEGNPTGVYNWEFQNTITKKWYHCRDSAIRWIDGRIVRLEIATDITEQKLTENALRQANKQLNLLSGITRHDILNTVNAMQLFVELAKMKIDISPAARDFENLGTAISMIQSKIDFTRVYQDLGTHSPQWITLQDILSSLKTPRHIKIINNSSDIEIFADPLISTVFENLLDNSIRHGKNASFVMISNMTNNTELIVVYEDNGSGIPAEEKELIFEQGYGKNTGYGLFFIREILSITGISIRETGQEGIGVRFEIILPDGVWRHRTVDTRGSG